jgi:hypothetical protein
MNSGCERLQQGQEFVHGRQNILERQPYATTGSSKAHEQHMMTVACSRTRCTTAAAAAN